MRDDYRGPLRGLRVLDCSTEIAGGYATKLFVDAGAEVIKVEPPGGDPLRRWSASHTPIAEGASGPLFQYLNASKRSLVLDVETAEGLEELLALAATADLVVENYAAELARRIGFDAARLRRGNAATSLVSISHWGRTGPWADRPATEFTVQAAVGATGYRGLPERGPVAAGGRFGEWIAGTYAGIGALAACLSARRTGEGRVVDLSMFECLSLSMTTYQDLNSQWVDTPPHQAIEIPSIEPAKDGWVGFCTITGQQWVDFCKLIGHPEVGEDEKFLDGAVRMENLAFMQEIMHGWTRERSVEEIIELASLMRIPVAPVGDGSSIPKMDHLAARDVYRRAPGGFLQPRPPYQLSRTTLRPVGPAPDLDAHGEEIRAELRGTLEASRAPEGGGSLPLEGVRVVDLTTFWAGPVSASLLATLGADVIKIESVQRPDGMRFAGAARRDTLWEWGSVYAGANQGKRAITLRLDHEDGIAQVKRLIADADVVIENFSPRVVENFGLGWEVVHELNPRAVMVRMPAFGLDGPWRDRTGFAMTIEQVSGLAWVTGYPDLPLVPRGACDPVGGMHAAFGLLLALEERKRSGEGQLVEVPLLESALNIAAEQVIEYSAHGVVLARDGNRGPGAAPQGVYRCASASGHVALAVATDAQWRALHELLGSPELAGQPDLETQAERRTHHDELDAALSSWFAGQDRDTVVERLVQAGIPAHAVINAHGLTPNPQLTHREFFETREHSVTGTTRYPGWPFGREAFGFHPRPPPTLGQHNEEVLSRVLGLSEEEIEKLRADQIIGDRPSFM